MKLYSTRNILDQAGIPVSGKATKQLTKTLREAGIRPAKEVKTALRKYTYWGADALAWAEKNKARKELAADLSQEIEAQEPKKTESVSASMFNRVLDELTGINAKLERLLSVWEK